MQPVLMFYIDFFRVLIQLSGQTNQGAVMSRPIIESLNSSLSDWVARLNRNFADCLSGPFPMGVFIDMAALDLAHPAGQYKDCFAIIDNVLYKSDGTSWVSYREPLVFVADLDTGTATVADVKNAYNALLADLRVKGYMV